jgi:hypothetical protein
MPVVLPEPNPTIIAAIAAEQALTDDQRAEIKACPNRTTQAGGC